MIIKNTRDVWLNQLMLSFLNNHHSFSNNIEAKSVNSNSLTHVLANECSPDSNANDIYQMCEFKLSYLQITHTTQHRKKCT